MPDAVLECPRRWLALYEPHVMSSRTKVEEDTQALEERLTGLSTSVRRG